MFLEVSQNSQENTYARVSILIKKETLAQVFSCELCQISKGIFFLEHLQWLFLEFRYRISLALLYFKQRNLNKSSFYPTLAVDLVAGTGNSTTPYALVFVVFRCCSGSHVRPSVISVLLSEGLSTLWRSVLGRPQQHLKVRCSSNLWKYYRFTCLVSLEN